MKCIQNLVIAALMLAPSSLGFIVNPQPPQDEAASKSDVEFTIKPGPFSDPEPDEITPENAGKIADRMAPFVQVQPHWDPPEGADLDRYREAYEAKRRETALKRLAVIGRLLELEVELEKMKWWVAERYELLIYYTPHGADGAIALAEAYLEQEPDGRYAAEAWVGRARARVHRHLYSTDPPDIYAALSVIEELRRSERDPMWTSFLLNMAAGRADGRGDRELSRHILTRIIEYFPGSQLARTATGLLDRNNWVGKTFDLEFDDALTGRRITMKDYEGKVVLVDFWATWCGPCVAAIPQVVELHNKYRERGFEVIAIAVQDEAEIVRRYCERHNLPDWPQFVGEEATEFARRWGVSGIPQYFMVDQSGRLHSVEARGREEQLILELLGE